MDALLIERLAGNPPPETEPLRFRLALRPRRPSRAHAWRPPTDVFETEDALVVRVEIAGMNPASFHISLDDRLLRIQGFRPDSGGQRAYHQMEVNFGEFLSEVTLPYPVLSDHVEAEYSEGFLRIVLPKLQAKSVPVE